MAKVKQKPQGLSSLHIFVIVLCVAVVAIVIVLTSTGFFPAGSLQQAVQNRNAAGFATLSINPPTQTVVVGDVLRLDIAVSGITDLAGAQVSVTYPSSILQPGQITVSPFFNQSGQAYLLNTTDRSVPGVIGKLAVAKTGAGVNGTGTVISAYFTAIGTGTAQLGLTNVLLSDSSAVSLAADVIGASITVNPPADTTPPVITGVASSGITASGAAISWSTNEASDSQAEYGLTAGYGSITPLNGALVTSHAQSLSGLAAGTLYHYRVRSKDAAGNLAMSGDFTLTTAAASDTIPPTVAITSPKNNSALPRRGSVKVQVSASDARGVSSIRIAIDGVTLKTCSAVTSCQYTWYVANVNAGSHTVTAAATDTAGNVGTASIRVVK